jgi:hypothetical protein
VLCDAAWPKLSHDHEEPEDAELSSPVVQRKHHVKGYVDDVVLIVEG